MAYVIKNTEYLVSQDATDPTLIHVSLRNTMNDGANEKTVWQDLAFVVDEPLTGAQVSERWTQAVTEANV